MRSFTRFARLATASIVTVLMLGATAHAATPQQKCKSTIIKESSKYTKARVKALQKCEEALAKGKAGYNSPPGMGCSDTGGKTSAALAKATSKYKGKIDKGCGGADKDCDAGGDDITLASIDWDIGSCPEFENQGCTNTISHCGGTASDGDGISDCLLCINDAAVDQAIQLYYDDLDAGEFGSSSDVNKCQLAIGKETAKFLQAKSKILVKCQDALNQGKPGFTAPCPSGDASGKTQTSINNAESKKIAKLCKACGGTDKACGGAPDLATGDIGVTSPCPDVQVPGGLDCGTIGTVDTVAKLVACVDCVTEFKVDCMDAAAAPGQSPYSNNCVGIVATPTPTPTISATPTVTFTPCAIPSPTGLCPTTVEFTSTGGTTADLDTGHTGISHDSDVPSNGRLTLSVSNCDNANHPCGECDTSGPIANAGGTAFNNRRCAQASWIECTSNVDCPMSSPCVYFFGAPLPLSSGAVPVCVTNEVVGSVMGTINVDDGSASTVIDLLSRVHPTGTVPKPCPNCVANVCDNGPRAGMACTTNGVSAQFGPVSLDCPPDPGANAGNLSIRLPTATGLQSATLSAANPSCRAVGYETFKCFCDTCNNANAESCMTDADCPDNPPATPGICGGPRCLGGADNGEPCAVPADCDLMNCGQPGGVATQPNACSNAVCVLNPGDTDSVQEGRCQNAPNDNLCSIETFRGCVSNSDCPAPGDSCTVKRRQCYMDNGTIGNSVLVEGDANPPCGDTASTKLGALFCVRHTGSSAVNSTAGLPGLGRLTLQGTSVIQ